LFAQLREYQLLVAEMVVVSVSALVGASFAGWVVLTKVRLGLGF